MGTPQNLSNELGECIWEIKQDTLGYDFRNLGNQQDNPFEYTNSVFWDMSKERALLDLKRKDKEIGLHYNRYYEPYSARYMSKDPTGLFGGLNNSVYVSDPNQWIDPLGLMEIFSSAECTYKISAQNLKYTKIITSLGATGIEREHQSIEFTKDDGIFWVDSNVKIIHHRNV